MKKNLEQNEKKSNVLIHFFSGEKNLNIRKIYK